MADRVDETAGVPGPATVFAAHFQSRAEAEVVHDKIISLGYDPIEVSYITDASKCSYTFDGPSNRWAESGTKGLVGGASLGVGVSGVAAALDLGSMLLLGPIGIAIGLAVGGVVGGLLGAGLNSDQASACETAIEEGGLVMAVQAHTGDSDRIRVALGRHIIATKEDVYL
jgi:hypothetical protein